MVIEVNVPVAEHDLLQYVDRALQGEEVIITREGSAGVRLVPLHHEAPEFSNELLASIDDREFNHYLG